MSLLTIVETKEIISVISDGQGTNSEGNVALTGFQKFFASTDFFIGIIGSYRVANSILDTIKEDPTDIEFVKHLLIQLQHFKALQEGSDEFTIVLCEHNFNEPVCTFYDYFNHEYTIQKLKLNECLPIIKHSPYLDNQIAHSARLKINQMVLSNCNREEIIQEQIDFHKLVSNLDPTVNDEIFHHIVNK
ncbi:hypothetical protein [Bacillus mycoides]|uniref:hypothetical protein n=1 Tax=Bacillus mycoides TaxID=1405 RepID=UPI000B4AF49E|nr:hypothetical protein [Bacillus mycoides]